jgi:hypothetical protein
MTMSPARCTRRDTGMPAARSAAGVTRNTLCITACGHVRTSVSRGNDAWMCAITAQ